MLQIPHCINKMVSHWKKLKMKKINLWLNGWPFIIKISVVNWNSLLTNHLKELNLLKDFQDWEVS